MLLSDRMNLRKKHMKKRNMNLELIRVISCIFVIVLHVSNVYRRNIDVVNTSYIFALLVNVVTRISVPMFFMISGALLMNRKINFSFDRIKVAIKPLAFWTIVYALWEIFYRRNNLTEIIDFIYDPVTKHLWYMYVMIGIYVALPYMQTLYQNLEKKMKTRFLTLWFLILLFTYMSSFFGYELAYEIPFIGGSSYYFGYFMLGAYLYEYKLDYNKYFTGIGSAVFLIYLGIWALFDVENVEKILYYKNFFLIVASGCAFHRLVMAQRLRFKEEWIQSVSKCSLHIYYGHIIVLDICKRCINFVSIHSIIGVVLFSAIVFGITYIFVLIYNKITEKIQSKG